MAAHKTNTEPNKAFNACTYRTTNTRPHPAHKVPNLLANRGCKVELGNTYSVTDHRHSCTDTEHSYHN